MHAHTQHTPVHTCTVNTCMSAWCIHARTCTAHTHAPTWCTHMHQHSTHAPAWCTHTYMPTECTHVRAYTAHVYVHTHTSHSLCCGSQAGPAPTLSPTFPGPCLAGSVQRPCAHTSWRGFWGCSEPLLPQGCISLRLQHPLVMREQEPFPSRLGRC